MHLITQESFGFGFKLYSLRREGCPGRGDSAWSCALHNSGAATLGNYDENGPPSG